MKKQNIVIIIVFSALLFGLGLLVWLTPDQDFSENENRYLQKLPELTADTVESGEFGDEVEDYLSDQFWQRDRWTAIRSRIKLLLQNKDIGGVYLCSDGYYIEKVTENDVDEERLQKNLETVRQFFDRCTELGLSADQLTFMPVPTPGYILQDKLPRYASLFDEDAVFDKMTALLGGQLADLRQMNSFITVPITTGLRRAHCWGINATARRWGFRFPPQRTTPWSTMRASEGRCTARCWTKMRQPIPLSCTVGAVIPP